MKKKPEIWTVSSHRQDGTLIATTTLEYVGREFREVETTYGLEPEEFEAYKKKLCDRISANYTGPA